MYRFTIFTPCFNSSAFIHRVFNSLSSQTFKDFEWYVINDASTDSTHDLISEFIKTAHFKVVYHNLEKNQGLHNNINQAVRDARGEFLVLYGHDDEIQPDALDTFDKLLKKYNSPDIGAVYALANDQNGNLVGKKYPKDEFVSDYWTQFFVYENEAEKFQCFRTSYLREFYPLPTEQDKVQPGGWLWGMMATKYKAVFVNKVLRIYYTNVSTSITNSYKGRKHKARMNYNYYTYWVNKFQYHIHGNTKRRFRGFGGYVSYAILAGVGYVESVSNIQKLSDRAIVALMFPIGYVINKFVK